jgi:hypothetical protein
MSKTPANGRGARQIDTRRELQAIDSRTTILTDRPNNRYFVQVGRPISAPEGVEKRSLRVIKVELGEVNGA